MDAKPAVQDVRSPWVDLVEEPCWVSLTTEGLYSSTFQVTYRQDQQVTFELPALQAVIRIQGSKTGRD